jgi:hypothetical protein
MPYWTIFEGPVPFVQKEANHCIWQTSAHLTIYVQAFQRCSHFSKTVGSTKHCFTKREYQIKNNVSNSITLAVGILRIIFLRGILPLCPLLFWDCNILSESISVLQTYYQLNLWNGRQQSGEIWCYSFINDCHDLYGHLTHSDACMQSFQHAH